MAFERLKTEIGILLTEMQNEPADKHELAQQVHAKLQELRAFGMPLPKDLIDLEEALESEFREVQIVRRPDKKPETE